MQRAEATTKDKLFAVGVVASSYAILFFIHHFGDVSRTLCSPLRVNPNCESTQVLRDTSMVECNIDVEENEVLRRINQAANDHDSRSIHYVPCATDEYRCI